MISGHFLFLIVVGIGGDVSPFCFSKYFDVFNDRDGFWGCIYRVLWADAFQRVGSNIANQRFNTLLIAFSNDGFGFLESLLGSFGH